MRVKVRVPTNGSDMILKARAAKGSSSDDGRSMAVSPSTYVGNQNKNAPWGGAPWVEGVASERGRGLKNYTTTRTHDFVAFFYWLVDTASTRRAHTHPSPSISVLDFHHTSPRRSARTNDRLNLLVLLFSDISRASLIYLHMIRHLDSHRNTLDGLHLDGRGHEVHHGVEKGLHALVLERRPREHRDEDVVQGARAEALLQRLDRRLLPLLSKTKTAGRTTQDEESRQRFITTG